jgi:hypothetical protein
MQGQLGEHPLAELIREVAASGQSGALRLSRERVKVAIYFDGGQLVFATSNLRTHRLREAVMRHGLPAEQLERFPPQTSDDELASALVRSGQLNPETLAVIRGKQVSDVLMVALLWTDGTWEFDPRVRVADDLRVRVDVNRLLLECARHLPAGFVAARLGATNSAYLKTVHDNGTNLLPAEASVLSRAADSITLRELTSLSGVGPEDGYRAVYALSLSGLLQRNDWPVALGGASSSAPVKAPSAQRVAPTERKADEIDEVADVEALFARLEKAKDHYDVLDVGRLAEGDEIKNAYHTLARRFHPDRFHQSEPELRSRVESAFARIAQAYETLSDSGQRATYDRAGSKASPSVPMGRPWRPATTCSARRIPSSSSSPSNNGGVSRNSINTSPRRQPKSPSSWKVTATKRRVKREKAPSSKATRANLSSS